MSTVCAHLVGYNLHEHLPVKTGEKDQLKFWMLLDGQPVMRELGDNHLTVIAGSEYAFGGIVLSEMAINGMLVLIIDTGVLQFYIEHSNITDTSKTGSLLGKYIRGKGNLSIGEYPYDVGVKIYDVTVKQITKVSISKDHIKTEGGLTSTPLYLSPVDYTEADTQFLTDLENEPNSDSAFYLVEYELD